MAMLNTAAESASVMLLPGVGFGIVPSDYLALHPKSRLPSAITLSIAFQANGVSRGTLLTTLKDLPNPGVIRSNGELIPARAGNETRRIDFGKGPQRDLFSYNDAYGRLMRIWEGHPLAGALASQPHIR